MHCPMILRKPGSALAAKPWRVVNEIFKFRCEPCRLISDAGPAEDENNLAHIGTCLARGD